MLERTDRPPIQIAIADQQDHLTFDPGFLEQVAHRALLEEQVATAQISIALVDDDAIHRINRDFLNHDEPTDVISFLLEEQRPAATRPATTPRGWKLALDGEIVISTETAVRAAAEFSWTARDEVVLYLVHGLLHLAGYDDLTPSERNLMRKREREILALWGLRPRYDDPQMDGINPADAQVEVPPPGGR